jgi:hypothetical protein
LLTRKHFVVSNLQGNIEKNQGIYQIWNHKILFEGF